MPTKALLAVADPRIHSRLEELLRLAGVEVGRALDRETALALGHRQRFALVVCDLPLRGATLREFLFELTGEGSLSAGCPVLLIGGPPPPPPFDGAGDIGHCRSELELLHTVATHLELEDARIRRLFDRLQPKAADG